MINQKTRIYTLGTSNRQIEEFLAILKKFGIKLVIDVRSFPQSKRFPHFNRENLTRVLEKIGLEYLWLGRELGGYRKGGYKAHLKTKEFAQGLQKLKALAKEKTTVLICAERFPWRCHRRFIAEVLEEEGFEVVHILDEQRTWRPSRIKPLDLRFPKGPSDV